MLVQTYSEEEKKEIIEGYKSSGMPVATYAKERGMPESTLRSWLKEVQNMTFGAIEIKASTVIPKAKNNTMVFVCENIRVELGEGFNKEFLRNIVEVLCSAK